MEACLDSYSIKSISVKKMEEWGGGGEMLKLQKFPIVYSTAGQTQNSIKESLWTILNTFLFF